nr:unnamed protein product [Spirometra erinaceieuropaei]
MIAIREACDDTGRVCGHISGHRETFTIPAGTKISTDTNYITVNKLEGVGAYIEINDNPPLDGVTSLGRLDVVNGEVVKNRVFTAQFLVTVRVTDSAAVPGPFAVTNGVKRDCVLAPTLFSLMFTAMLVDACHDERPGIRVAYRTDGHLLNHLLMHFQSREFTTTVHELLFTDDCALNATTEGDMQRSMDLFSAACDNFGLIINTEKTMVLHQPPPDAAYAAPQISVNESPNFQASRQPFGYATLKGDGPG